MSEQAFIQETNRYVVMFFFLTIRLPSSLVDLNSHRLVTSALDYKTASGENMNVPEWFARAQCPKYDRLSPRAKWRKMILLQEESHRTFPSPTEGAPNHSGPTTGEIENLSMASTSEMNSGS